MHSGTLGLGNFVTALVPSSSRWGRHNSVTGTKAHESYPSKMSIMRNLTCGPDHEREYRTMIKLYVFHPYFHVTLSGTNRCSLYIQPSQS